MSDQDETDNSSDGPLPAEGGDEQAEQATGSPAKSTWSRKTCDERTYEAIYQEWKNGTKQAIVLAQKWGLSDDTVRRFINKGLPRQHRPSFRVKLQMEGKAFSAASEKAAEKIAEEMVGEAREIRKHTLSVTKAGRAVIGHMVARIIEQIKSTPLTRHATRLVRIGEGENQQLVREDYERAMDMYEVGQVMQKIAGGLSQLSRVEMAALGIEDPENPLSGIGEEEQLTQAEVDYILANGGKLPEGMTVEELIRRGGLNYGLLVGTAQPKAKKDFQQ